MLGLGETDEEVIQTMKVRPLDTSLTNEMNFFLAKISLFGFQQLLNCYLSGS
jgi:hypothetical protein